MSQALHPLLGISTGLWASVREHRGLGAGPGELGARGSVVYVGLKRDRSPAGTAIVASRIQVTPGREGAILSFHGSLEEEFRGPWWMLKLAEADHHYLNSVLFKSFINMLGAQNMLHRFDPSLLSRACCCSV